MSGWIIKTQLVSLLRGNQCLEPSKHWNVSVTKLFFKYILFIINTNFKNSNFLRKCDWIKWETYLDVAIWTPKSPKTVPPTKWYDPTRTGLHVSIDWCRPLQIAEKLIQQKESSMISSLEKTIIYNECTKSLIFESPKSWMFVSTHHSVPPSSSCVPILYSDTEYNPNRFPANTVTFAPMADRTYRWSRPALLRSWG